MGKNVPKESKSSLLLKNTFVFAIGNFATKLISFLLVPLYTCALSPEQFGTIDILYTVCSFLVPLFSFNIIEAVWRFSLDDDCEHNNVMSIAFVCMLFMMVTSLVMIPILSYFDNFSNYKILFYFYLVTFGISQILLINIKGKKKLKLYSLGNFIYALLVSIFNIYFLLVLNKGIEGYFLAYILANIITIVYGVIFGNVFESIRNFKFEGKLFKEMIKYSTLLIPTSFMWWIMNFLDRIMVINYISLSANGIYAISYKIPSILSIVSSIFIQAWLLSAIEEKDSDDNVEYTNKIFNFMAFGTIFVGSLLLLCLKPLFSILVAAEYWEAWKYVPYLMIGYVFLNVSTFISTTYNVHKDSKGLLLSAFAGASVNFILNLILIPLIGVSGAALATSICYFVVFLYRLFDTKRYLPIKISCEFVVCILLMIIISALLYVQNMYIFIIQLLFLILIMVIYRKSWISVLKYFIRKLKVKKV